MFFAEPYFIQIGSSVLTYFLEWDRTLLPSSSAFVEIPPGHYRTGLYYVEERQYLTLTGLELRPLCRRAHSPSLY